LNEAKHYHLPLGFNCLRLPSSGCFCDSFKYYTSHTTLITLQTLQILVCEYAYYTKYYTRNGSKCLYCLKFIQSSVNEQVQIILEWLQKNIDTSSEDSNKVISEDDKNNKKETANNIFVK
ncbi:7554_t:CDS:1, partial [Dentiscutata erythropus]